MSFIKLKEYCKNRSISYITGYRWFKNKQIPGAYQTESGTILIPDNFSGNNKSDKTDAISLLLEKSVEFNNNEASIIDFTAYILSNFTVSLNEDSDVPKYSKNKPKTEDVQKHFQKFIPEKESIDHLKMIKSLIKDNKNVLSESELKVTMTESLNNDMGLLSNGLTAAFVTPNATSVHLYDQAVEGVVSRNVELESTPQQFSYTGSTNITPLNSFSENLNTQLYPSIVLQEPEPPPEPIVPKRKRGRKPMNKSGNNQY